MTRTLIRQDKQVRESEAYVDTVVPSEANYETLPATLQEDLNNLRSLLHHYRDLQTSDWWNPLSAVSGPEPGPPRGLQQLNEALHLLEVKRWLREVPNLTDITIPAAQNYLILGTGELPTQLVAAVTSTTLGTVVAPHSGTFGTNSLDVVAGSSALSPANLVTISDGDTREAITSGGKPVWGLLQSESGLLDGENISDSAPDRVQISFVITNATGDGFVAATAADIASKKINYCFRERVRLKDLLEGDLLKGAFGAGGGGSGLTEDEHENLDTLTHQLVEDSFDEVVRNTKGRIIRVTTWTDSGKTLKIREALIDRVCGRISTLTTIQYNSSGTETYRVVEDVTRGTTFDDDYVISVERDRV
jgi:hypothetical protein